MITRSLIGISFCCCAGIVYAQQTNSPNGNPSAENPEYTAAKAAAEANWMNPPLTTNGVKDVVGVLTHDADELNAVRVLYQNASPSVKGAVDGSMLQAAGIIKVYGSNILTEHKCELTPLAATVDPLSRAATQLSDSSVCLGGQPSETLGHKIANQGNVRALERQLTFGAFGHGDKAFAMNKAVDPKSAASIDFAVQQVVNNFSKNDVAAEMARQRQSPGAPPQIVPTTVSPKAIAPPVPVRPAHPASTMLDLPPAQPGYPPMHAAEAAQDGCWWAPFASEKLGIELAVLHCDTTGLGAIAGESTNGVTLLSSGATSAPEQVLTLETKPASQTLEAAIKQQFIMKLKSPAARLSCQAKCEPTKDGLVSCSVIATGAYSRQKRFNQDDDSSDDPCPGLSSNDAIAYAFYSRPSESRTKFLFYSADDLGTALSEPTIHFLTQQP